MIKYLKSMLYTLVIVLIGTTILSIFNYFNILNGITHNILLLLTPLIGVLIGSFLIGKVSNKKGYIEGLKYGLIWILIFLLINLIIKNFTPMSIIYYIILLIISALAGVIGINKKKG